MEYESMGEADTRSIAKALAEKARPGEIYCLSGDLGVGKTIFTKGFADGLGIAGDYVTSPTFTIMNAYEGRLPLYHFDVYRIGSLEEMDDTGYEDFFFGEGVCFVEWAELIAPLIPQDAVWITIAKNYEKDENYRKILIERGKGLDHADFSD